MENFEFEIAENFINQTGVSMFLTGNAGTGKTTFLRHIIRTTKKKCVVVAPTGVAAINAGGVTIHSMFGLPTKSFIPSNDPVDPNLANNKGMLAGHFHYHRDKLQVIHEMELLVVDEVSMVRADILDAVDWALRYTRRSQKPFGGVQVMFIGDMYQLPPVVKDDEWPLLSQYYESQYFFHSKVFQELNPVYVELKKIYRQSDRHFIRILNNIRHQDLQEDDYEVLKSLYKPGFEPSEDGYIVLTTHNKKADAINERELQKLEGREMQLVAEVTGEFSESMYPTESVLRMKVGAQVMFVKNDTSGERRYFNGKIGIIESIDYEDGIAIRIPDSDELIQVQKEVWENVRYAVGQEDNKIERSQVGSFSQYPIRLAWAITIHKSQGLTFEKAVIDAGESFAPGQVYVALSRCTSMDNLVLYSLITNRNIFSDPRIVDFSRRIMGEMTLETHLEAGKKQFAVEQLIQVFDMEKLLNAVGDWEKKAMKLKSVSHAEIIRHSASMRAVLKSLSEVSQKFRNQLQQIADTTADDAQRLDLFRDRCTKAIDYFADHLYIQVLKPWSEYTDGLKYKSKQKRLYTFCDNLLYLFRRKVQALYATSFMGERLYQGSPKEEEQEDTAAPALKGAKPKVKKGASVEDTLSLFREGKTASEIATIRGLVTSTIESHFAKLISNGEIRLSELLPEGTIKAIEAVLERLGDVPASAIKAELPEDISFNQIRWVINAQAVAMASESETPEA